MATQDARIAELVTPLGKDRLVFRSFDGTSGLSELFVHRIEALAYGAEVDFDVALGRNCTLVMTGHDGNDRHFDGILTEIHCLDGCDDAHAYRLVLRPWFWLLSRTTNSRIFADKTVVEIIAEVFRNHAFARHADALTRTYPVRDYCVQYRESDMDFVCRLMEENGISYFFRHAMGTHTLVLADGPTSWDKAKPTSIPYSQDGDRPERLEEHLGRWSPTRTFTSGKIVLNDYDFKKPSARLLVEKYGDAAYAEGRLELYDHPGHYETTSVGLALATAKIDAVKTPDNRVFATGQSPSLAPGLVFTLTGHPDLGQNGSYLVTRSTHRFASEAYRTGSGESDGGYYGEYEVLKSDARVAPPAITPTPFVQGPQTAKVVGDGEIDVDEYGRIKVQFHWDRQKKPSRRCRVAQVWAGKQWGGIVVPRVGMEVIVDFLEGNPDNPIVIGTVYNADNMPPFSLPGKKAVSGMKSNSTPGGGGHNQFSFDDTKGSELVYLHAEQDLEAVVGNNEKRTIGMDRLTTVGDKDVLDVGESLVITAGSKIEFMVGSSRMTMTPTNILVESMNIEIAAKAQLKTKGLSVEHTADGVMVLKGALIKIN